MKIIKNETIKKETFKAYLAGVVDSDGSISIARRHPKRINPTFSVLVQITWTKSPKSLKVFDKIISLYGGTYCEIASRWTDAFKQTAITIKYSIATQTAKQFLIDIKPYLKLKYKQAELALKLINSTKRGKYGNKRPKPKKLKIFHYKLYIKNKQLNSKNDKNEYSNK